MEAVLEGARGSKPSLSMSSQGSLKLRLPTQQAISQAFSWAIEDMSAALKDFLATNFHASEDVVKVMESNGWASLESLVELACEDPYSTIKEVSRDELVAPPFWQALGQALCLGTFLLETKPMLEQMTGEHVELEVYIKYLQDIEDEALFLQDLDNRGVRKMGRRIKRHLAMAMDDYYHEYIYGPQRHQIHTPMPTVTRHKPRSSARQVLQKQSPPSSLGSAPAHISSSYPKTNSPGSSSASSPKALSDSGKPRNNKAKLPKPPSPVIVDTAHASEPPIHTLSRFEPRERPSYQVHREPISSQQQQPPKSHKDEAPIAETVLPSRNCPPPSPPFSEPKYVQDPPVPEAPDPFRCKPHSQFPMAPRTVNLDHPSIKIESLGYTSQSSPIPFGNAPTVSSRQKDAIAFHQAGITPKLGSNMTIRRSVLPKEVTWDGNLDTFEEFKDLLSGHYMQVGAGYLFDTTFQASYLQDGINCYIHFPEDIPNILQLKKDVQSLYGALMSSCKRGAGSVILMHHKTSQDGLMAWMEMLDRFDADGDKETCIMRLEDRLNTPFSRMYKGGLTQWLMDYEAAMAELSILGSPAYLTDQAKRRRIVGMLTKDPNFHLIAFISRNMAYPELITSLRQLSIRADSPWDPSVFTHEPRAPLHETQGRQPLDMMTNCAYSGEDIAGSHGSMLIQDVIGHDERMSFQDTKKEEALGMKEILLN